MGGLDNGGTEKLGFGGIYKVRDASCRLSCDSRLLDFKTKGVPMRYRHKNYPKGKKFWVNPLIAFVINYLFVVPSTADFVAVFVKGRCDVMR